MNQNEAKAAVALTVTVVGAGFTIFDKIKSARFQRSLREVQLDIAKTSVFPMTSEMTASQRAAERVSKRIENGEYPDPAMMLQDYKLQYEFEKIAVHLQK